MPCQLAVPGRTGCPQPLHREHGRVLPPALGAQLEERLLCALLRLQPAAPHRWVQSTGVWGVTGCPLSSTHPPTAGDVPLPTAPRGPAARHRGPTASCTVWAGSRYRSFDGRHFGFQGECAYSLAASTDSTWAVSITPGSPPVPTTPEGMRRCWGGWVTPWVVALGQRGCPHSVSQSR